MMRAVCIALGLLMLTAGCDQALAPPKNVPTPAAKKSDPTSDPKATPQPATPSNGGGDTKTPAVIPSAKDNAHMTGDPVWDKYATAQKQWYRDQANLMMEGQANLKAVVELDLQRQFARVDMKAARFRHILRTDSTSLIRNKGLTEFVNFEWSNADAAKLMESDAEAKVIAEREAQLDASCRAHAQWKASRDRFREVSRTGAYLEAHQKFQQALTEAGALLK